MKPVAIVVAMERSRGIGKDGDIPWHVPADLRHLKRITTSTAGTGVHNAVIMGRKTWQSLPASMQPLRGRQNIVLSRQSSLVTAPDVPVVASLDLALALANDAEDVESVFVLGGQRVYAEALAHPACRDLYITRIDHDFDGCDAHFPAVPAAYQQVAELARGTSGGFDYAIEHWRRRAIAREPA